ncbi:transcription factor IBH1-like [Tripterygium wilfordii]|uniref:Transcription factor IBH1-like n=1 Tax=Tripterygium wilfordii TaxID=458696 RepID=A0A7J7DIZ0_TRIWF|nr:transcription factor IBH1-like [Tripterygium wilfordii]KAF5746268.1 transcription factor IBH1-like [Tripterygium wilfordii]
MNSYSPSSTLKSRFTRRFLRALMKINSGQQTASPRDVHRRYRRVRIAADKSLALAVGSRRSWSRALLCKIRTQKRRHRRRCASTRRISSTTSTQREKCLGLKGKSRELQKLVPGSEGMDLCSLLDETAHYIKCLATQVQAMRCIAHSCNSP